jgi:hypothetical protein
MTLQSLNSKFWKTLFLIAGLYTMGGVLPGIINPQNGILEFTNKAIKNWSTIYFFKSLWITVFVFGIGFLMVAKKPTNHIGIVVMGFLGKLLFALNILSQYQNGHFSHMANLAAIIDLIFVVAFGVFIFKYSKLNK